MSARRMALWATVVIVGAAGCSDAGTDLGPPLNSYDVATVEIIAAPVLPLGAEGQLQVVLRDARGNVIVGPAITYSSDDPRIVTVTQSGRVRGVSPGETDVVAEAAGKKGKGRIRVQQESPRVAAVRVNPSPALTSTGGTTRLTAEAVDSAGNTLSGVTFTWSSSNVAVARVDSTGLVTGVAAGTAQVVATAETASGTADVLVEATSPPPAPPPASPGVVTDLAVTGSTASELTVRFTQVHDGTGGPARYQVRVMPAPATHWGAMTPVSVGTCAGVVNGTAVGAPLTCVIGGLAAGTAYGVQVIAYRGSMADGTAVFGEPSNIAQGTTVQDRGRLEITPRSVSLTGVGSTQQLTVVARDASGNTISNPGVTWSSSNTGVATVSSTGLVTARAVGTALIVAAAACCTADTVALSVDEGTTNRNLVFRSTWATATGNSDQAVSDGGLWNRLYCWEGRPNVLSVVSGASVGWSRTPNVLAIRQTQECGNVERVPTVPASTTHWGRFWWRNDETSTDHMHPVTYNVSGTIQMVPWARAGKSNGHQIAVSTPRYGNGSPASYNHSMWWLRPQLQNGVWYRYEWMIEYVSATAYRVWPRVYSMAGALLYDASNYFWRDSTGDPSQSLATFYANGGTFGVNDVERARNFGLGNEGPGGSRATMGYWYIADVGLSLEGWIGSQ